jgi:hypothetical protein
MPQDTAADIRLVLDGALTMRTVDDLRATLRAAIEPPPGIVPCGIAPGGTAPAGTAPTDVAPTDVPPADVPPTDVPPADVAPRDVAIDCSVASEIDLTFIQLLIAARVSTQARGQRISLMPCPDGVLLDVLTRGGFRLMPESDGGFWFTGEAA